MKAIILDDESFSADYLENLCMDIRGLEIAAKFGNAAEALAWLPGKEIQLAFLDIEMPGLSGMEAVEELRKIQPELAVVFVTAHEQYALDAFHADAAAYLLKPCTGAEVARAVEKVHKLAAPPRKRVRIQTFGRFCVFFDGEPFRFVNGKAKELLALLVDQRGGVVTIEQAVDALWEGRPYDSAVKQLYRKAVIYLHQITDERGLDFFMSGRGSCYILPSRLDCDYFRLLEGDPEARRQFHGEYLLNYSWGETRTAELLAFVGQ